MVDINYQIKAQSMMTANMPISNMLLYLIFVLKLGQK